VTHRAEGRLGGLKKSFLPKLHKVVRINLEDEEINNITLQQPPRSDLCVGSVTTLIDSVIFKGWMRPSESYRKIKIAKEI
jgi:hypothetical protein